ncbi:glycosyltransferase family 2 protein [Lederbergia panacisoli]|uniref:glycosyltransferase family 2 protein n=1 Tax=Lederbergia panacisoli TaxID=1255251 RepID=UPI00214BE83A|nr:glycosyltransferase family A protein [Lederbergia panacisoli]MCR2823821.1 glycosyltransferase family 2 protein [Lederbergia panacisoli]
MFPFVSVIIPVYNSEKSLGYCIDSLINQTYKDIEIIIINDGSTDNSEKIAQEYENKDLRVKVITKINGGVSSARNMGIKEALGEYILFVDSDDSIELDSIERLHEIYLIKKYDTIIFNYNNVYNTKVVKNESFLINGFKIDKNSKMDLYDFCVKSSKLAPCWNKLHKSTIIKNHELYFREDMICAEDALFSMEFLTYIESGIFIDIPLYNYVRDNTSAVNKYDYRYMYSTMLFLNSLRKLLKQWGINTDKYNRILDDRIIHSIFGKMNLIYNAPNLKTLKSKYIEFFKIIKDKEILKLLNTKEGDKLRLTYRFQWQLIRKNQYLGCFIISMFIHKTYKFIKQIYKSSQNNINTS